MTREILFKAKRKDNNEWVEGCYLYSAVEEMHYIVIPSYAVISSSERGFYEIDPATLCQFTGLYDSNDKRIWEHDILSSPEWGCDGTVVWEDGGFTLDNGETSDVIGYQIKLHLYEYPESIITVVCSTFDNPELLTPTNHD